MPILFCCAQCAATYDVDDDLEGKTIRCRECHGSNKVPALVSCICSFCGSRIRVSEKLAGCKAKCPKCRAQTLIPIGAKDHTSSRTAATRANRAETVVSPTPSATLDEPSSQHRPPPSPPAPTPKYPSPTGQMILCYVCRKQLADTALTCPKCGAVQTAEGREKGRQMKKQEQMFSLIVTLVIAVPLFGCCFIGMTSNSRNSSPPPEKSVPAGWDMDKVKQDADEVARDPSKTIFVPKDGSQPRVVPNP